MCVTIRSLTRKSHWNPLRYLCYRHLPNWPKKFFSSKTPKLLHKRDRERNRQTRKVLRQPRVSNQVLGEEPRSETLVHKQFASSLHSFLFHKNTSEIKISRLFVLKQDRNQHKTCTTTKKWGEKEETHGGLWDLREVDGGEEKPMRSCEGFVVYI